MASPKTIIITHIPRSTSGGSIGIANTMKMASLLPSNSNQQQQQQPRLELNGGLKDSKPCTIPPRKRQRLDHLTMEEKMMRRKLKNRVAAQSARDRKRALMQDLEVEVRELELKNSNLEDENERLHQRNEELERENADLRKRLECLPEITTSVKQEPVEEECTPKNSCQSSSVEYASLISDPLPKGQDRLAAALWMMHFVGLLMWNLMNSSMSCKNSAKSWTSKKPQMEKLMKMGNPSVEWWGPHQKNWNPSKN